MKKTTKKTTKKNPSKASQKKAVRDLDVKTAMGSKVGGGGGGCEAPTESVTFRKRA